jgi:hypothetical protein
MQGLTECTMTNTYVCPELSRVFPEHEEISSVTAPRSIKGEIDIFVDGDLRWVVKCSNITELKMLFCD